MDTYQIIRTVDFEDTVIETFQKETFGEAKQYYYGWGYSDYYPHSDDVLEPTYCLRLKNS